MGTGASKRNISCPVCTQANLTNKDFVEHYRKAHNRKCSKCGLSGFETEESMYRHYDQQHNKMNTGGFLCWKCAETFTDESGLMQHLKSEHNLCLNMSKLSLRSNGEKPSCSECGKVKKNSERLQKHVEKNHRFVCQKCDSKLHFTTLKELLNHGEEAHGSLFQCPIKCTKKFSNVDDFLQHLLKEHNFAFVSSPNHKVDDKHICPQCNETLKANEIFDHVTQNHIDVKPQVYKIKCPKCEDNDAEFETSDKLIDHMREAHDFASKVNLKATKTNAGNKRVKERNQILPKVGDRVLAMWEVSMWQYFHATIKKKIEGQLRYEIDWDDGDTTGRFVNYSNLAVDRAPIAHEIGVGSIILFSQGQYRAGQTQLTGGMRWHQGRITSITKQQNGGTLYSGVHTKTEADGKFSTYKGYSYEFHNLYLNDLRVGPNVFDLLDDDEVSDGECDGVVDAGDVDVYFSCFGNDGDNAYSPKAVADELKSKGISVIQSKDLSNELDAEARLNSMKHANLMMKKAKVFVACISDQYTQNQTCRMEFQFAKSTLKKPVVPIVFGEGREWQLSVVGMLISGELYIEIKEKCDREAKIQSMLTSISSHLDLSKVSNNGDGNTVSGGVDVVDNSKPPDIFISYCWTNSTMAFQSSQIPKAVGSEYADPRLIKKKIDGHGFTTWLDIEQLKSGDQGVGMFEQLANALKDTKMVVAFISDEYANSVNCRMEFQFAFRTIQKPILPVVVGTGEKWKQSVVGIMIGVNDGLEPISLQEIKSNEDFDQSLNSIMKKISDILDKDTIPLDQAPERKSKKPKVGDHIISHHVGHCYYTATVAEYNASTMEYTVTWDDGDTSGRVQKYDQVALDKVPEPDAVGLDSIIFFPQGQYVFNGNRCQRYHEGIVTNIHRNSDGKYLVDGHHTKGADDGKSTRYRDYCYEFKNIRVESVRIAPSALDTMI
uniref:C2H2-type domain-containing protein n=1 Tax=Clytia hemisphaerica TaxID=252671 RepID=A0A7M5UQ35_9CNID